MPNKNSKIPKSFIDRFPLLFKKTAAQDLSEPQRETEKTLIPEDGEVQLQNPNVVADSVEVSELKTDVEFTRAEDQNLGKGQFYVMEDTVFFSPEDKGRRVQIEYLWLEEPSEIQEYPSNVVIDEDEDEEEDSEGDVDEDEKEEAEEPPLDFGSEKEEKEEKETKTTPKSKSSDWSIDSSWFKWKPLEKDVTVNNSLRAKLEKGLDLQQGFTVTDKATGQVLKSKITSLKNEKPTNLPGPGDVAYSYSDGFLHFGDPEDSGKTFHVEYFIPGKNTQVLTLGTDNKDKEFELVEGLKGRSQDLWTAILDHPDPAFVTEHIIPLIENEVEALLEKQKKDEDSSLPSSGDFIKFEHLLARREQDDNEDNRRLARDFIETDLSPKLTKLYSLASLISERVYDMQSEEEPDEDFPEFQGSGGRSFDRKILSYTKKVRQTANELDRETLDFSKYYTKLLSSWIQSGATYFNGNKAVPFSVVKDVFDRAGIGIADLQLVALDAFRKAILEYDREKRPSNIVDPKDFVVSSNPLIRYRVRAALQRVFDKYKKEQQVENTEREGFLTLTVPESGGLISLSSSGDPVKGFRLDDLVIKNTKGTKFTSANAIRVSSDRGVGRRDSQLTILQLPRNYVPQGTEVSVSTIDGDKFERLNGPEPESMEKLKSNPGANFFYFARNSWRIYLGLDFLGDSYMVEIPKSHASGPVGKNQYRPDSSSGTIEFSPQNGGELVSIKYTQKIKAKRFVNPAGTEGEGEEEELSLEDLVSAEGTSPEEQADALDRKVKLDGFIEVVENILNDTQDPRLSNKERKLLKDILGLNASGKRMSVQDISESSEYKHAKDKGAIKIAIEKAQNTLGTILAEKTADNKRLRSMLAPFSKSLLGKGSGIVEDKFLAYLTDSNSLPERVEGFRHVLDGILGADSASLTQDEENILRWMWAAPGNLRRTEESFSDKEALPSGTAPAYDVGERLRDIAIAEFGVEGEPSRINPKDLRIKPEDLEIVRNSYDSALKKFDAAFAARLKKRRSFFTDKYPDFVHFYEAQTGKQSLRDEMLAIEQGESLTPKNPKVKAPKPPLFEQIKKTLPGVAPDMLKGLMTELSESSKAGGSIDSLIKQREEDLKKITEKGKKHLDKSSAPLRKEVEDIRKAIESTDSQIASIAQEKEESKNTEENLHKKIFSTLPPEESKAITQQGRKLRLLKEILFAIPRGSLKDVFRTVDTSNISNESKREEAEWRNGALEDYSYLTSDGVDLETEQEDLQDEAEETKQSLDSLVENAVGLADADSRKELAQLHQKNLSLASDLEKFSDLKVKQQSTFEAKKKELSKAQAPFKNRLDDQVKNHDSAKELDVLRKVHTFLKDREDLTRSDRTFNVENMFGPPEEDKNGPGYVSPKLAPGEKDTYRPADEEMRLKPKVEPATPSGGNLDTFNLQSPEGTGKRNNATDLTSEEVADMKDKVKFKPLKKETDIGTERSFRTERSLADELKAVALKYDPEETKKAWQTRLKNFDVLLKALQNHFTKGQSILTFKPSLSESSTLPNQQEVIRDIAQYLVDHCADLKVSRGVWDLSDMNKVSIVKNVEDFTKIPDPDGDIAAIESLSNAQASLPNKEMAEALHRIIQIVSRGKSIDQIVEGLKVKSAKGANVALDLAERLRFFLSLHSDLKVDGKWDLSSLYDGTHKFPSANEVKASRPLDRQMEPLVQSIQKQLKLDSKNGGIESEAATQERVLDMLLRMKQLAEKGADLDKMGDVFLLTDQKQPRSYSLASLFGSVRAYINKLNRTVGLANMSDDYGLSKVFGEGAPAGSPSEQDEVNPAPINPTAQRSPAFQLFVKTSKLTEEEQKTAYNILLKVQLSMEEGNPAAVVVAELMKQNKSLVPVIRKILEYVGRNREELSSGIPGYPDLSSLTSIPFNHPAETGKEAPTGVSPMSEIMQSKPPVPDEALKKKLRKSIFEDMATDLQLDDDQKNIFADAIRVLKDVSIEALSAKTKGTILQNIVELIVQEFLEKGLVNEKHLPDFRGVSLPSLGKRKPFFEKDGTPNIPAVESAEPDFNADELADDMPEPAAVSEEEEEDLDEAIQPDNRKISPDMQKARDFLLSDQVQGVDAPRDSAIARLQRNAWQMLSTDFDFTEDETETVLKLMHEIKDRGADAVLSTLTGGSKSLVEDIVDYLKHTVGLEEKDFAGIVVPEVKKEEEVKPTHKLTPTVRSEVDPVQLFNMLKYLKGYSKSKDFYVDSFVRALEGRMWPDQAKNALLKASEDGYISLEAGEPHDDDLNFIPVNAEGEALTKGKFLKMPIQAPDTLDVSVGPATKGRLSKELGDKPLTAEDIDQITESQGLSKDAIADMASDYENGLVGISYTKILNHVKSKGTRPEVRNTVTKFVTGLIKHLRANAPAPTTSPAAPAPKAAPVKAPSSKQAPAPVPAPAAPSMEDSKLKRTLYDKAIEFCTSKGLLSDLPFKILLSKKNSPELMRAYEQVSPKVIEALEAIANSSGDDIDI